MIEDVYTIVMIVCVILISFVYSIYALKEEQQKIKYYDKNLYYDTKWDKYITMLRMQKRVILKKQIQLYFLKILLSIKKVFVWK